MDKDTILEGVQTGGVVKSANATVMSRIKETGRLVFRKFTKPGVAQLEVVAAEFYRHSLGDRTSHGKVTVGEDGKTITGMYVEAVPGFISMKDLVALAKDPKGYEKIDEKIDKLTKEIAAIETKIAVGEEGENPTYLKAKLLEKQNSLGAYGEIKRLKLINTETGMVELSKISGFVAKALCTAFFYQDWDRHKDNFGLSFANGRLDVASLDYDKSLTDIFGQDGKVYDWTITPKRLRYFPVFNCWYWPTSSSLLREKASKLFAPDKVPKMFSDQEASQYAALKDDPSFRQQAQIEWLKLLFIPQELRAATVGKFANPGCRPSEKSKHTLGEIPGLLEERREALLGSLVRLTSFREALRNDPKSLFKTVKEQMRASLSAEEFKMVEAHWNFVQGDIEYKARQIDYLEEKAKELGYSQLVSAIERTGITFSHELDESDLKTTLGKIIDVSKSSKYICKTLNQELGLDISEADARKIKEEVYLARICKDFPPELSSKLKGQFALGKITIRGGFSLWSEATLRGIKRFESAVKACKGKKGVEFEASFKTAVEGLRALGVSSEVITIEDLELLKIELRPPPSTPIRPR